ncbi:putative ABC transport system ATP-binding protein [Pseudonocardia hierapolitana]|uniref:Putative ABC transport system ATP-binding protein n=1 Tax=Pseudonocardia hierapolitana TaxID=1128676 RepID=A0A561T072_9PSEU|nr:ABC transporter ATP-binding protein [Pseudonocardia hierapolitana]TWF80519.1 putative ABC transport system ATP-binding protein [Pseudonocardia hierapolitana]
MATTGSRVLLDGIRRNRRWLTTGSAMYGGHQICEALVPVVIGVIIDRAVATGDVGALVFWVAVLAVLFVVLSLMWRFGARLLTYAEAGEGCALRVEVAGKILQPRGIRSDLRSGELLTISSSDADNASYLLDYIPRIVASVTATAVCAITLLVINVPLGLAVVVGTPLVLVLLHLGTPLITRRIQHQQESAGEAASVATDLVSGLRPLRGIGAQDAATQRYRDVSRRSLRATLRAARTQRGFEGISTTISNLLAAGIAIAAGLLALDGALSIGQFVTVIGLAQFLVEPLVQLTVVPSWVAEARASANRVALVLSAPPLVPDGRRALDAPPHGLDIVDLRYRSIDGLDLSVRPGELVGVVAPQAADAEALVTALSGQVPPEDYRGTIAVGGVDLASVEHRAARAALLVEPHNTDIFTGTVGSNILVGDAPTSDPALLDSTFLERALRASAADDVVSTQTGGLDTEVSERGTSLSGGQRQRLALARALFARPPVLVLHDPTTAVDSVTEHAIARGLSRLRHGPGQTFTTVLVTCSPILLATAHRIVMIDGGAVRATGSHDELVDQDSEYRKAVLR